MSNTHLTHSQAGVIGDNVHIEGGIHFYTQSSLDVPFQCPPRAEHFTGREQELAQLLADLQPEKVITLSGPGGIGKTALTAEAIARLPEDRFPDGIIFYSFHTQLTDASAYEHIVCSYEPNAYRTDLNAVRRVLSRKQGLLILDSAENADHLSELLDVRGTCGVLIISRRRSDAHSNCQVLDKLPLSDAVSLLQAWGKDYAQNSDVAQRISELVGFLPLALRLVGHYLNTHKENAVNYLRWLETTPLKALHYGFHQDQSIHILLEKSLAQVAPATRTLFAIITTLAFTSFDYLPLAATLDDGDAATLRHSLDELVNYNLLLRAIPSPIRASLAPVRAGECRLKP